MKAKNVLVSGYIGFNNFGDEAIFYALSKHLKNLGYNVSALCTNTNEVKKKYDVDVYRYKSPFDIIKAIFNADILISGGGSLLQNKTSNFSLYYYLFIILLTKLLFKKVIIFAQGIEPVRGEFNKVLMKCILKTVDFITVRDNNSLEYLKNSKIKANLVSDPVYSLIFDTEICNTKEGLIIQLRKTKGMNEEFISNLADIISSFYLKNNISVFSFQDDYDKEICLKFIEKLKAKGKYAEFISQKNVEDTIEILNKAKYVISARLHGIIVSQGLKTKTFALIYDDKIKTISDELNIENVDINNYSKEELNEKIKLFFNSEDNTKKNREFCWDEIDKKLKEF